MSLGSKIRTIKETLLRDVHYNDIDARNAAGYDSPNIDEELKPFLALAAKTLAEVKKALSYGLWESTTVKLWVNTSVGMLMLSTSREDLINEYKAEVYRSAEEMSTYILGLQGAYGEVEEYVGIGANGYVENYGKIRRIFHTEHPYYKIYNSGVYKYGMPIAVWVIENVGLILTVLVVGSLAYQICKSYITSRGSNED